MERPNVHIISLQLVIHDYTCEHWFIATEPYNKIPTIQTFSLDKDVYSDHI